MPLAITDEELAIVRDLFTPLSPNERRAALEMLGASLTEWMLYRCAAAIVKKIRGVPAAIDGTG